MNRIRNFVIISHIDHGKSTLADRFLEVTGTIPKEKMRPQYLDMMDLERERGITIKMQPVRMVYRPPKIRNPLDAKQTFWRAASEIPNKSQTQNSKFQTDNFEFRASNFEFPDSEYILNLIDTPGHVDFSYEVSRALAAVEGAILLVDATKSIQAQTIANLELAKQQNLTIIPVINKIDLAQARIEQVKEEISNLLKIPQEEIFTISAKLGTNTEKLLGVVIKKVPPPETDLEKCLRCLVFDSKYDSFKGVITFIRVVEGRLSVGEKIFLMQNRVSAEAKELGFFEPSPKAVKELKAGEIGFIATGIKEPGKVRVGETITKISGSKFLISNIEPLSGYNEPKPMVFASIYPENPDDFEDLKTALSKLKLNDASFVFEPEAKEILGRGFRCGFLGTLHVEILAERLRREFLLNLVISTPSVVYQIINQKGKEFLVYSASDWPNPNEIKEIKELWVKLEVIAPQIFLGQVLKILENLRGKQIQIKYFGPERLILVYETPLLEIITGFYEKLKSQSQGFASMNYEILGYRKSDLVKLEVLIAGKKEEAFSKIVLRELSQKEGKKIVEKLKEILPAQLFSVPVQAQVSGKIIARANISAKRRDVTAPLYGGDYTRKKKLLEKQKKGKKELKEKGKIKIPPKVFLEMMRT